MHAENSQSAPVKKKHTLQQKTPTSHKIAGVKINEICDCDLFLSQKLLPVVCHISSEFIFQHDSSPEHSAQ